jgi:hypothetical protein
MTNPLSPTSFQDLLPVLRAIQRDAEHRARELGEYLESISRERPDQVDAHIGDQHAGAGFVNDLLGRIEQTAHIHSGSGDASRVRMATSGLLTLLATLQRDDRTAEIA